MREDKVNLSRRTALLRLGLTVGAVYCAPVVTGLSKARASSSPSPSSGPSSSGASGVSRQSAPSPGSVPSGAGNRTGSSSPTGCSGPSGSERAKISRRDMDRSNAAVARGEALSLREVVAIVKSEHPGRLIEVGFETRSDRQFYWLRIVARGGALQTVTVEAATGQISGVRGC